MIVCSPNRQNILSGGFPHLCQQIEDCGQCHYRLPPTQCHRWTGQSRLRCVALASFTLPEMRCRLCGRLFLIGRGSQDRRASKEFRKPGSSPRPRSAPVNIRETKVQISKRTAQSNVAYCQRRGPNFRQFRLNQVEGSVDLVCLSVEDRLHLLRSGRFRSVRHSTRMSSMPVPSAHQRRACQRAGPDAGYSVIGGLVVSRYSQITSESNKALPSAVVSVGILLKGLNRCSSTFGIAIAVTERTRSTCPSRPFSKTHIDTLRTKGEIGPPAIPCARPETCSSESVQTGRVMTQYLGTHTSIGYPRA